MPQKAIRTTNTSKTDKIQRIAIHFNDGEQLVFTPSGKTKVAIFSNYEQQASSTFSSIPMKLTRRKVAIRFTAKKNVWRKNAA